MIESYRRDLGRANRDIRISLRVMGGGFAFVTLGVLISALTGDRVGVLLSAPGGAIAGFALGIYILTRRDRRKIQKRIDNYQHRGFGLYW